MPTKPEKINVLSGKGSQFVREWVLDAGETGDPVTLPEYTDASVHIWFDGDSGTVQLMGSLEHDDNDFQVSRGAVLDDPLGSPLSGITGPNNKIKVLLPHVILFWPERQPGGTGQVTVRLRAV